MIRSMYLLIAAALLLSLVGSACGPTPTPEKVVETVVVTKEVVKEVPKEVVKEVVVTPTPLPAKPCPDQIVVCWTPPDITGVLRTATDFFNL